jgi:hypothetical protein
MRARATSHSHDQKDERGDEKGHRRDDLRARGDEDQNRHSGEEHHPREPAPIQGRGAKIDHRHEHGERHKLGAAL